MKTKKSLIWMLCIIALAVVMAVICWLVLPASVAVQFTYNGQGGVMISRTVGISVALGACLLGAILYRVDEQEPRSLIFSAGGFIIYLILLLVNL